VNLPHPYNRYAPQLWKFVVATYCNEEKENFFTELRRAIWEWNEGFNEIGIQ